MECVLLSWLIAGPLIGLGLGIRRGQPIGGCFLGLLLGPLGWLLVLVSEDSRRTPCPACREPIMKDAEVCPFCRTRFLSATAATGQDAELELEDT